MNKVLVRLIDNGVTEPERLRDMAAMMMAAATDSQYLRQAENVLEMDEAQLNQAIQQIIGGR